MKFPIALQLYSVRDDLANDFEGTLKKVKEMGYEGVEFAGLFGHSAEQVKALCEKYGLNPISAHVALQDMISNSDIFDDYAKIGCEFVVIPYLTEEYRPGQPQFNDVIKYAAVFGEKAKALGMKLGYHNHDFEFTKINGEYALDILYKEVSADLLQTELDTCWVNIGGEDPVKYIQKYAGRCEIIHFKDFIGGKTENMYGLIGLDEDEKKVACGQFEFRPLGQGLQNVPAMLQACKDSKVSWIIVEQDGVCQGKSAMQCAKESFDYLLTINK